MAIAAHFQAKKGSVHAGLLAALGVFAPLFAYLSGPIRQIVGYHIVVLGVHCFVLWNLAKPEQERSP